MPQATIETISLSDGYRSAVRWWRPPKPRGAVLYLHGIQSHGGWYEASAGMLADRGFAVLMPDRRGSGLNQDQRGHAISAQQCLADVAEMLDHLLLAVGRTDAHVVGISWGGKLAAALAGTAAGPKIRTLSLVAPGIYPKVDLSPTEKFRVGLAMVHDRGRPFEIPLNAPRLFTANPERLRFLEQDDLKLTQVTASFLLASRRLDRLARRFWEKPWRGAVHLMLAGQDKIIENERTRAWLRGLPVQDRRTTEYPDAEHTLEFEPNPEPFFRDLCDWIEARSDGS